MGAVYDDGFAEEDVCEADAMFAEVVDLERRWGGERQYALLIARVFFVDEDCEADCYSDDCHQADCAPGAEIRERPEQIGDVEQEGENAEYVAQSTFISRGTAKCQR